MTVTEGHGGQFGEAAANDGGNDGHGDTGGGGEARITIREGTGNDVAGVISVGHRTWPATYEPIAGPEYVAMGLAKWWTPDVVSRSIRAGHTLVAVDSRSHGGAEVASRAGEVIGVATYGVQDDDFVLWKLYVLPSHHGQDIGSRLLAAVTERARELGHSRITLSHIAGNDNAAAFYRAHGFRETHRESGGSGLPDSIWVAHDIDGPNVARDRG